MGYDLKLAAAICHKFEGMPVNKKTGLCHAYPDPKTQGAPYTIGAGSCFHLDGTPIREGETMTVEEAEELFLASLQKYANAVLKKIPAKHLNYNRFSAATSFAYNLGIGRFNSCTATKLWQQGLYEQAADSYALWFSPGSRVEKGLKRRRNAEKEIFLKPTDK
jgi:GH24 family phage-related lysozyme (muramidase)